MSRFTMLALPILWLAMPLVGPAADEAPEDAWPMMRGTLAGSGRSAVRLRFPLVEAWHRRLEKTAFEATPVIAGGTIFVGDLDGTFHALALDGGETRWTFRSDAGFPAAAAVSSDPRVPIVVAGDAEGIVRGLDRETGAVRWEHRTGGEISGGPTIMPTADGPRVLVGSQDASLTCLDLRTGEVTWTHEIADQIRCSPTVAGGTVFIAGCDGRLHAVDATTGRETAVVPIDGPTGTTPAADAGRIFLGTEGGIFYGIDIAPPGVAWKTEAGVKGRSYRSSPGIAGDLAIVGSRGRRLEAFARADGSQRWQRPMRGRVDASPLIVRGVGEPSIEVAIVADSAGRIVAVDATHGGAIWEFDAGGDFVGGAAAADGRVVLAGGDGSIWCFADSQP